MARARNIGNVYAELSVKDKMTVGIGRATKSLKNFSVAAVKTGVVAGTVLAAGLAAGAKRALDLGGRLSDVSAQTGIAVADVMKLERAYSEGGLAASGMGKDIARMQKNISDVSRGRGSTNPFEELGLSVEKLMQMRPADQFDAIGTALSKIENPTRRNALAMEIFGKSGSKLATVFGKVGIASKSLGRMPEVAEKFADSFDRASDIIGGMGSKSDQFFVGFTSGIVGQILPGLEKVNEFDFTTLGENLGDTIGSALSGLKDGMFWEAVSLQIAASIAKGTGGLRNNIETGIRGFVGESLAKMGWDQNAEIAFQEQRKWASKSNPIADELQADADALFAELDRRQRNAKAAAEGVSRVETSGSNSWWDKSGIPMPIDESQLKGIQSGTASGIPGLSDMMDAISRAVMSQYDDPQKPQENDRAWESVSAEVNSMQARGLGMGAMGVPQEVKDQVSLLQQIRDVLKKASAEGAIIFAN